MKDYYREKALQEQKKVELMKTAIEVEFKHIAKRFETADADSLGEIVKELTRLLEVYEDVVKDAEYYRNAYNEKLEDSDGKD